MNGKKVPPPYDSTVCEPELHGMIAPNHGFIVGDQVYAGPEMFRWERLVMLLTEPRITVITKVDSLGFNFERRRMTWREWWRELWRVFTNG